jgi:ribonuclease D
VIASDLALAEFLASIAPLERLALDTEADSLHCYFEKLCLIQISVPGADVLVDPLADLRLAPLFEMLARKQVVMHGADFDIRMLRRAGQTAMGKVFDTMIAARLTGCVEFSLSALITRHFGVTLTKGSQKANWAMRPLSPTMEEYARNDTRYLLALADILGERLAQLGRRAWFEQSCERVVEQAMTTRERDLENAWRISGSFALEPRAAAVLRALWRWRDEEARAVDRPAFHILRNEDLVEAAHRFHRGDRVAFDHLRGGRAKRFFSAAEEALRLDESQWPVRPRGTRTRPTPAEERRFFELKKKRDHIAGQLGIDPSLIAPKATIEMLACEREDALARLMPWQRELLEIGV